MRATISGRKKTSKSGTRGERRGCGGGGGERQGEREGERESRLPAEKYLIESHIALTKNGFMNTDADCGNAPLKS